MTKSEGSTEQYDVCLSFAGEDRAYVEAVAARLRDKGISCFYDGYEEVELWGKNLYDHLSDIYSTRSRFCVLFISEHYSKKLWTNHERKSAQARAFKESREYLLPARFDDTEIPGLEPTVGYVSLEGRTPENFAELVSAKVQGEPLVPSGETDPPPPVVPHYKRPLVWVVLALLILALVAWANLPRGGVVPSGEPETEGTADFKSVDDEGTQEEPDVAAPIQDTRADLPPEPIAANEGGERSLDETADENVGADGSDEPDGRLKVGPTGTWAELVSYAYVFGPEEPSFKLSLQGAFGAQELEGSAELKVLLRTNQRQVLLESVEYRTQRMNQRLVAKFTRPDGGEVRITVDLRVRAIVELVEPRELEVLPRAGGGFDVEPFYTSSCDFRCYVFRLEGRWSAVAGATKKGGEILARVSERGVGVDLISGIEFAATGPTLTDFSWHGNTGGVTIPAIVDEELEGIRIRIVPSYGSFAPIVRSRATPRSAE